MDHRNLSEKSIQKMKNNLNNVTGVISDIYSCSYLLRFIMLHKTKFGGISCSMRRAFSQLATLKKYLNFVII